MEQLDTSALTDQDISSYLCVHTHVSAAKRLVMVTALIDGVAGNGDYAIYITRTLLGAGSAYMIGPITTFAVPPGQTAIGFQSGEIAVNGLDELRVYVKGLPADTAVDTRVEINHLLAKQEIRDAMQLAPLLNNPAADSIDDLLADGTATAVWSNGIRTLTSTAAATTAALSGSTLTLTLGCSFSATLANVTLPATWRKLWLTIKLRRTDADSAALLQLVLSKPGAAATDGVLYVNGVAATNTERVQGSLSVDEGQGTVTLVLDKALLAVLDVEVTGVWDLKYLDSAGNAVQVRAGVATTQYAVTQAYA